MAFKIKGFEKESLTMKSKKTSQEPFEIGDTSVNAGTRQIVRIPFSTFPGHVGFALNVMVVHGHLPGKTLFISSTIHGDELNGIEIIRRVLESPMTKRIKGTLIAIPIVNLTGLFMQTRYLPDRRDLNRSFPGSENGSSASQLAHIFLNEIVEKCTHGIDFHTGSNNRTNLPQIRCDFESEETLKMALIFGAPVILKAKLRDGSLREASEKLGIPTLTFEGGESLRFNEAAIRACVQGVFRTMGSLDMIPMEKCASLKAAPVISPTSKWARAPATGIFRTACTLGDKVLKGDVIGQVTDALGVHTADVIATLDGIIIGQNQLPIVYKGDALIEEFEE
jgi:predicted deacylase